MLTPMGRVHGDFSLPPVGQSSALLVAFFHEYPEIAFAARGGHWPRYCSCQLGFRQHHDT
jgi:hypothetical protein